MRAIARSMIVVEIGSSTKTAEIPKAPPMAPESAARTRWSRASGSAVFVGIVLSAYLRACVRATCVAREAVSETACGRACPSSSIGRPASADNRAAKLGVSKASTARLSACRSSSEIATSGGALSSASITPEFDETWLIGAIWIRIRDSRIPQSAFSVGLSPTCRALSSTCGRPPI